MHQGLSFEVSTTSVRSISSNPNPKHGTLAVIRWSLSRTKNIGESKVKQVPTIVVLDAGVVGLTHGAEAEAELVLFNGGVTHQEGAIRTPLQLILRFFPVECVSNIY